MADATRSALGRRSRRKGKAFELVVRDRLLEGLNFTSPDGGLVIRRSSQAERAWDADLIIEGPPQVPQWLLDLWVECEHSNDPDPAAKLVQAKRDAGAAAMRTKRMRTPLVCWRRTGERTIWCSTEHHWLTEMIGCGDASTFTHGIGFLVTCKLGELLSVISRRL